MVPAIIIAKGHSNRLPHKNILPFCGLPLVEWSIIQASSAHLIDKVFLSTDSEHIAEIGRKYNAEIIWRKSKVGEEVSGGYVVTYALRELQKKYDFDVFCSLLPTSPCREPNDIDRAVKAFNENKRNITRLSALYCPKEMTVYEKVTWRTDGNYYFPVIWNKNYRYLNGNSNVYISYVNNYLNLLSKPEGDNAIDLRWEVYGIPENGIAGYIEIEWYQQFDIDDKDDFEFCEILMERYILKGRGPEIYEEYGRSKS